MRAGCLDRCQITRYGWLLLRRWERDWARCARSTACTVAAGRSAVGAESRGSDRAFFALVGSGHQPVGNRRSSSAELAEQLLVLNPVIGSGTVEKHASAS